MTLLKRNEVAFLAKHEVCRLATASKDLKPHVTPVIYALDNENVIVVVDYGTKKLSNLRENNNVSLVVDDYRPNRAVMIQGRCEIIERGKEYLRLLQILFNRFEYYRKNPWKEGEAPILRVTTEKVVSWGLS